MSLKACFRSVVLLVIFLFTSFLSVQHRDRRYDPSGSLDPMAIVENLSLRFPTLEANNPNNPVDLARSLYYYVAGPPTGGYPGGFEGPENGLFGILDQILGDSFVQKSFFNRNITSCQSIPNVGVMSVPQHALGKMKFHFSPGSRRIPGHFATSPNGFLSKRIDVDRDGVQILSLEMACDNGDGIVSGFMLVEDERKIEVYYQFDNNGNRRQVDVYMDYPKTVGNAFDEKFVLRFESIDGEEYQIWSVRTTKNLDDDDSTEDSDSVGVAIRGNASVETAQVSIVEDKNGSPDDVTNVVSGTQYCLDMITGETTTGCEPVQPPEIGVKGDEFTIGETDAVPVETIDYLRADTFNHTFASVGSGGVETKVITLTNAGVEDISGIAPNNLVVPFEYAGGSFPGVGGTCGVSLAAGSTCTFVVQFAPTSTGSFSEEIDMGYVYGSSTRQMLIQLSGSTSDGLPTAILATLDGGVVDFGAVPVGGTVVRPVVLTNVGQGVATNLAGAPMAPPFSYSGGTCSATLAAQATCQVMINYAPTTAGTQSAAVSFNYGNGQSTQSLTVEALGEGVAPALITISESDPFNFGTAPVGGSLNHSFVLTNVGGGFATGLNGAGLTSPFEFAGGVYPGLGGTCGASLPGGSTCEVVLTFAPTAATTSTSTLAINYNDGATVQVATRSLTGTGASSAVLTISGVDPFNFGNTTIGNTVSDTFTVTNSGGAPATGLSEVGLAAPFGFSGGGYPGTGGTCTSTLVSGASCTIHVAFSPVTAGSFNDSIDLTFNDGAASQTISRGVSGTAGSVAQLTLSDGPNYDFGTVTLGGSTSHTMTLTNTGGASATSISGSGLVAPFSFAGGSFPGTGGTCGVTLAAAASCTLTIAFQPTVAGLQNGTLTVNYNDGVSASSVTRDVLGTGAGAGMLSISEGEPYNFGSVSIGGSASHTFTVTNSGSGNATSINENALSAPFQFAGSVYPGTGGTCGTTLAGGTSCTLVVVFSPTTIGSSTGNLSLSYNNGAGVASATRGVQGTGVTPATLSISESNPFDFGTIPVGGNAQQMFTLTNTGGLAATGLVETGLAAPFSFVGGVYPGTGGDCGSVLGAAGSCTLNIELSPLATGAISDTIIINYNDGSVTQSVTRDVQGTGVSSAFLTVSGSSPYDFGSTAVGTTASHTFTVSNSGGITATAFSGSGLAAPYSFLGGSFPGSGGTCSTNLASGSSCTLVIEFAPSAAGTTNDTLELSYNNGTSTQSLSHMITGMGAAPALLTISEIDPYDFGSAAVGGTSSHSFTVTNTGGGTAFSIFESGLVGPFGFAGGSYPGAGGTCGTTLGSGSSCTLNIEFSPQALGLVVESIDLNYNNGSSAQLATRALEGTGANPASLTISDGPTYDFGSVANGTMASKVLTITNVGGVSATSISGTGLATPFSFSGLVYPGIGGSCGTTLASGSSCNVEIEFAPSSVNSFSDSMEIQYSDGIAAQNVTRALQGTGI